MNLKTGVDLIEIQRIANAIERYGERFLARVYTADELALIGEDQASLAARFAAKEAVSKALGTGIGAVSFQEIEILRDEARAPVLYLHGEAQQIAQKFGLTTWSISLSHTQTHAIAMVVAISQ